MKNSNVILREKQHKYQPHHQVKLINMNILQVKKYYLPINNRQIIVKVKFTHSPLEKYLEKQTVNQVDALKYLNLSNKRNELK